jgi:hypothetical protein
MFRCLVPVLAAAAVAALAGCEKFPTPAELDHPTVLAVIADPPVIAPGASSRLTVIAADYDGPIAAPPTGWALVPTFPGVEPMGRVVANADGSATYTAPDPVPALPDKVPPVDSVQATVAVAPQVVAVKLVVVQAGVVSPNPVITDITLDGVSIANGGTIGVNAPAQLAMTVDGTPDENWSYAWYATAVRIPHYQSNPTDVEGADAPLDGWIYAVVRDGRGGAAVRAVQVTAR